ncbi:unnamed protein product [Durusdinium trenchii]|uniref:START domain-containing protein n=2 Tax=Durusdinium trenchii TaxID=1381693 RepID=A0ABP0HP33_9DINO
MGLTTSCCAKGEEVLVDDVQKVEAFGDGTAEESPTGLSGTETAPVEDSKSLPRLPSAASASDAISIKTDGDRYTARQLLLMGRYIEAEELLKETGEDEDGVQGFLEKVMPSMREIAVRARLPTEKEGYTKLEIPEHNMVVYVRRAETIDVCFSTDLPATWEKMLAMNWEADLSSQWLPFSPEVVTTYSQRASQLMLYVHAKIPALPGSREAYIHRHVVDCFTPNSILDGRQGLLIVEKSPDNWKTGGVFMDEFHVKPPPSSRWVTRDEQLESFTFYEYVNPTTIRCFIRYKLNFNISPWLFPNVALFALAKFTGKRWHAGLMNALEKFEDFGYQKRVDERKFPIYDAVLERALKRSRMDLLGEDGPTSPQAVSEKTSLKAAGKAVLAVGALSSAKRKPGTEEEEKGANWASAS